MSDLERFATVLYVQQRGEASAHERAGELRRLKPHVSPADALDAVNFVDTVLRDARTPG